MAGLNRRDFGKFGGLLVGGLFGGGAGAVSGMTAEPPVFLIGTHVAGTSYIDGIDRVAASISVGDRLDLRREASNPFDELAILVLGQFAIKLGYVPQRDNPVLARLMDSGKQLFAVVEEKEQLGAWHRIGVRIYMVA